MGINALSHGEASRITKFRRLVELMRMRPWAQWENLDTRLSHMPWSLVRPSQLHLRYRRGLYWVMRKEEATFCNTCVVGTRISDTS